jgi:DNA-binding Lrp family transcriptional regulator
MQNDRISMTDRRIDAIDEKLMALLSQNARMTLTALSRAVALSRTAVQARMARLEKAGLILGYRAICAAPDSGGLGAVLSIIFNQRPCAPVVAKFRNWPEIEAYFSVTGPIDAYAIVRVADTLALAALVDRLSAIGGIGSVHSAVILKG